MKSNRLGMKSPFVESLEYHGFALLSNLAQSFSYKTAGKVGGILGSCIYTLVRTRRAVALDNLAHAFPRLDEGERTRIAREAFKNYGTALVEMLWSGGKSAEELMSKIRPISPAILERYFKGSNGLILLSAHYGNWEFLPQGLRLRLGRSMTMIAQRQRNKRINAMIEAARIRWDNRTVSMGVSSREAFKVLREGAMMLILSDQSGPKEAVFIDFFGRPAATHRGAAAFSLKTGAPIVLVLLVRKNDGTYEPVFEEVDRAGIEKYTEENVIELTRRHTAVLEKHIRLHPEQWLWMHKRWKHTEYYQATRLVEEEA